MWMAHSGRLILTYIPLSELRDFLPASVIQTRENGFEIGDGYNLFSVITKLGYLSISLLKAKLNSPVSRAATADTEP